MSLGRYGCHGALLLLLATDVAATGGSPEPAPALPVTLLVRVLDSASQRPLPNAEVSAAPVRRLTDARGEVRFTWPAEGTLAIRVRQIGFRYVDRILRRGTSPSATEDTVVVALARASFALPQVAVRAQALCRAGPESSSDSLTTSSMDLLRFGAEQYDNFRAAYPFVTSIHRRTEMRNLRSDARRVLESDESTHSDEWGDTYRPGRVLERTPEGYFIPLLFVSTLADSAFWQRHCFVARGVETKQDRRMIRLDFAPARGIRDVEWAGSAWLDSAAGVLARVDFRLENLRDPQAPERLEGYTLFSVPSPFIAVPDSTVAWWWRRAPSYRDDDQSRADVRQFITPERLKFVRGRPPAGT